MKETTQSKGSVLLIVLGVLALLSLLGTALVIMARQELRASKNYMDETRAQFAAEAGIETALAKLSGFQGSLIDLPKFTAFGPENPSTPLEHITFPSFAVDLNGDGTLDSSSGMLSETYKQYGDQFKLKVESCQSKLNINDTNSPMNIDTDPYEDQLTPERDYSAIPEHMRNKGHSYPHNDDDRNDPSQDRDPDWIYPEDPDYNPEDAIKLSKPYPRAQGRLWTIVKELTDILFQDTAVPPASPTLGERTANAIFKARKRNLNDRFNGFHEIKGALVPEILSQDQYLLLENHFTLGSWQDENVLRPTFQWRINTPPTYDPGIPGFSPTRHICDYPGDGIGMDSPDELLYWGRPCPRPGTAHPGLRGADMLDEVQFDFDNDGVIEEHEKLRHDRDIYIFGDMQTRYFETERRSPVDINDCPKELLEALILPAQGWYMQEAPAIWRGEDPRSRAEDWSQSVWQFYHYCYEFPWFSSQRYHILARPNQIKALCLGDFGPDESQYYYYDSYAKQCLNTTTDWWSNPPQPGGPSFTCYWAAGKSARFGELQQSQSFRTHVDFTDETVAEILSNRIYDHVHNTDLDGDGAADHNPFQTWEEFDEFILDLADPNSDHLTGNPKDFDIYMAHALMANFNPNSRLNDFNPDKRAFLYVDKSQLTGFSAELCFHALEPFLIESLGMVKDGQGSIISQSELSCGAKVFDIFRISSQAQFMQAYDGSRASAAAILGQSSDANPTFGAETTAGNLPDGAFNGYTLQSYPEPEIQLENYINESLYDGCLRLATLQPLQAEFFASGGSETANNSFVANFRRTLNADYAEGSPEIKADHTDSFWIVDPWRFGVYDEGRGETGYPPAWGGFYGNTWADMGRLPEMTAQIPANNPFFRPLCKSLGQIYSGDKPLDLPGNLHPDGVLSDTGRTPRYECPNNFGDSNTVEPPSAGRNYEQVVCGRRGSVQFWIKPNFDVAHSNRIRNLFCCPPRRGDGGYADLRSRDGTLTKSGPWDIFSDHCREMSLYYFSRGGRRVVTNPDGKLDDDFFTSYHPSWSKNDGRWIPTRSLFFMNGECMDAYSWTWYTLFSSLKNENFPGLGTSSVNQSWRTESDSPTPGNHAFHLESHQWSHIGLSWNWMGDFVGVGNGFFGKNYNPPARFFRMSVNGQPIEEDREQRPKVDYWQWDVYMDIEPWSTVFQGAWGEFWSSTYCLDPWINKYDCGAPNYFRFGETSSAEWRNNVADSTYDDFVCSKRQHEDPNMALEYSYGRYYSGNDAVYSSPAFDLFLQSDADWLSLHSVAWTGYWPLPANPDVHADHPRFNDNRLAGSSDWYSNMAGIVPSAFKYNPKGKPDPMSAKWGASYAPFSVDVFDPMSGNWRYESNLVSKEDMPNYAGGSKDPDWQANPLRWEKARSDKFRFRVHFNIAEGQTLFTSPIFDDITFIFKMEQPKILYWEIM